ncbi:ankyrin repeat domain-containing protein [Croceimicrobium sp.]|uniref:ankyrin repeat domain-containing protein n=1 Tax=Croceimicrobium sp. TaxID=2828340 RepID=UPI003BA9C893
MNALNFFQRKNLLKSLSLMLIFSLSIACQNQNSESSEVKIEAPEMDIATAVISGNLVAVKQHIAAGTDLNQKDAFTGSTPLITAATFDKREIAQALIDGGSDLSLQNNDGSSALHSAAFFGRVEIVQMLIDAKADKNLRNTYGATPREIVLADFEAMKPVYQMMQEQLSPMGLQLDMVALEKARPVIALMLE